jgi:hypothetical protein
MREDVWLEAPHDGTIGLVAQEADARGPLWAVEARARSPCSVWSRCRPSRFSGEYLASPGSRLRLPAIGHPTSRGRKALEDLAYYFGGIAERVRQAGRARSCLPRQPIELPNSLPVGTTVPEELACGIWRYASSCRRPPPRAVPPRPLWRRRMARGTADPGRGRCCLVAAVSFGIPQ